MSASDEPAGAEPKRDEPHDIWGTTDFAPGDAIGLVGRRTIALVESGEPGAREILWRMVAVDAPLDDLLDELSATGLKSLPSFSIAQLDGTEVRVVTRGVAKATVHRADGESTEIDPSDVRTWVEHVDHDPVAIDLVIDEDRSIERGGEEAADIFHVLAGAVPARLLHRSYSQPDPHAAQADEWTISGATQATAAAGEVMGAVSAGSGLPHQPDVVQNPSPADSPIDWAYEDPDSTRLSSPPSVDLTMARSALADVGQSGGGVDTPDAESEPPIDPSATLSATDFDGLDAPEEGQPPDSTAGSESASDEGEESSGDYDFIYGHTVARQVEDAAVRAEEGSPDADAAAAERGNAAGLISAVPSGSGTVPAVSSDSGVQGDHDGLTITRAQLNALRQEPGRTGTPAANAHDVMAIVCPSGHPNPLHVTECRRCGEYLATSTPLAVPRPPLGVLAFSNGDRVVLDRTVLIGRNPKIRGTVAGDLPRLAKFDDVGRSLSRTHAEIRLEGWQILLEDLQSTNGTEVRLPGQALQRVRAGEPVVLVEGTVIEFDTDLTGSIEAYE